MIELILGMAVIIVLLGGLLWISMKNTAEASARAKEAYEGLARIKQAHEAVEKQMQVEQEQFNDDQINIGARHHFGD
ncbi:MAG: hypothetical protein GQ532_18340 [Methylomarinum sp.]|nr:hypothetical protein [Methylomarinum sp.]